MHGASLINLSCLNVKLKINASMEWRIKRGASEREKRKGQMEWIVVYFHWCENQEISCCFRWTFFRWVGEGNECSLILYAFRSRNACVCTFGLNKVIDLVVDVKQRESSNRVKLKKKSNKTLANLRTFSFIYSLLTFLGSVLVANIVEWYNNEQSSIEIHANCRT